MSSSLGSSYKQMNDIDCAATSSWNSGAGFAPVGSSGSKFTGTLNGNGYKISNLTINRNGATGVGLFGYTSSAATITKVGLVNATVISRTYSGALVAVNEGTVSQSYSTGTVSSLFQAIGGLVGHNDGGTVSNSYSTATVSSNIESEIGGLVGWNDSGTVTNSYSTGLVNNGVEAHSGMDAVGGLIGFSFGGSVANSFWDMDTSGQDFSWAGTGKTTTQMKTASTFTGASWDFTTIWTINASNNNGYPYLLWQSYPTPTPTSSPASSQGSAGSITVSAPQCGDRAPENAPNLFQVSSNGSTVTLYFVPVHGANNKYYISYGLDSRAEGFGAEFPYTDKSGVIRYDISALFPGTWYFKVRGQNGCMPGAWSSVQTVKVGYGVSSVTKTASVAPVSGKCTDYTVQSGDSLWKIASTHLGSGRQFTTLMQQNNLSSSRIRPGQVLRVGC